MLTTQPPNREAVKPLRKPSLRWISVPEGCRVLLFIRFQNSVIRAVGVGRLELQFVGFIEHFGGFLHLFDFVKLRQAFVWNRHWCISGSIGRLRLHGVAAGWRQYWNAEALATFPARWILHHPISERLICSPDRLRATESHISTASVASFLRNLRAARGSAATDDSGGTSCCDATQGRFWRWRRRRCWRWVSRSGAPLSNHRMVRR